MRFDEVIEKLYSSDDELICEVLNEGLHISQCVGEDEVVTTGFQCKCQTGTVFEALYLVSQQRICYKKVPYTRLPIGVSYKFDPNLRLGNFDGYYNSGFFRSEEDNHTWYDFFDIKSGTFHKVKYKDLMKDNDKNILGFILDGDISISSFDIYENHLKIQSYPLFSDIPALYKSEKFSSYASINSRYSYRDTSWNNYGRSCEKYDGYNGWGDDLIDDVFGGIPEATWNVD